MYSIFFWCQITIQQMALSSHLFSRGSTGTAVALPFLLPAPHKSTQFSVDLSDTGYTEPKGSPKHRMFLQKDQVAKLQYKWSVHT